MHYLRLIATLLEFWCDTHTDNWCDSFASVSTPIISVMFTPTEFGVIITLYLHTRIWSDFISPIWLVVAIHAATHFQMLHRYIAI